MFDIGVGIETKNVCVELSRSFNTTSLSHLAMSRVVIFEDGRELCSPKPSSVYQSDIKKNHYNVGRCWFTYVTYYAGSNGADFTERLFSCIFSFTHVGSNIIVVITISGNKLQYVIQNMPFHSHV